MIIPLPHLRGQATLLSLALLLAGAVCGRADNLLEKDNPGFEDGLNAWTADPAASPMFQAIPEAASMGKLGLRTGRTDGTANFKAKLVSQRVPANPGHIYRLTFWSNTYGHLNSDAGMQFYDATGQPIPAAPSPGFWPGSVLNMRDGSSPYLMQAVAPSAASTVGVEISTRAGTIGYSDLDDFDLEDMPAAAAVKTLTAPPIDVAPLLTEVAKDPNRGQPPPKIVIKIDDLTGSLWGKWQRVTDFAAQRKIKVNIGIIAKSLDSNDTALFQHIKDLQATGMVEFWFHAWDHQNWTSPDGKSHGEFVDRTYDEQKKRFDDAQRLAQEKLGFAFAAFGAPGNAWDDTTLKVLQAEPALKTFIYGDPAHPAGKIVLTRVGCVNIETPTFFPRYDQFVAGYVHNRGRGYFVIQGHPWHWTDADFAEFVKIVDFLTAHGAAFVTASELAAQLPPPSPAPVATAAPAAPFRNPIGRLEANAR